MKREYEEKKEVGMVTASVRFAVCVSVLLGMAGAVSGQELRFRAQGEGVFGFDTGELRGRLAAQPGSQGILSLVDVKTGRELTHGFKDYGIFSVYRLLSANNRWGHSGWEWPKEGRLLEDGAVQIAWPAQDDHPVELTAVYRWRAPGTLDLELSARPAQDAAGLEVFLASYLSSASRGEAFLKPGMHERGKAGLVPADVSPLTVGTYLSFPRDRAASQIFYDGRWEKGPNPVQWSVTRQMAGPLAVQRMGDGGISVALMARPEDCFAINLSYNREPPDGVAGHHSTYFSLFGRDVKAGETVRARLRLMVGRALAAEKIVEAFQGFCQ